MPTAAITSLPNRDFDLVLRFAQHCVAELPLVVVGSGASVPFGLPGMWDLGQHLISTIDQQSYSGRDNTAVEAFKTLIQRGIPLEEALFRTQLGEEPTRDIVSATWTYISTADKRVFNRLLYNRGELWLSRLYTHLFRGTQREIDVITPNYDRLAEYAASVAGYVVHTGFDYGHIQRWSGDGGLRLLRGSTRERTVNIWKVHGSLDWFHCPTYGITGFPMATTLPEGLTPIIVTPGSEKYRLTHSEPYRTVMQRADDAIRRAKAFLCIGYGFNDEHIQSKLVERCVTDNIPIVVIAQTITDSTHRFLTTGRCRRYMAIQEHGSGSRVFCSERPEAPLDFAQPFWSLNNFLDLVTA